MLTTNKTKTLIGVCLKDKSQVVEKKIYYKDIEDVIKETKELQPIKSDIKSLPPDPKRAKYESILEDEVKDKALEDKKMFREFIAPEGQHCEPFYRANERITMFVPGPQNCGKSYFISEFLDEYKVFHPKRPIYLLTGLDESDKHFERHNMRKILMDADTIGSLSLEDLRMDDETGKRLGCLLIFDDTDRIPNKGLIKKVYDLMGIALSTGRDHRTQNGDADIDVIITNHEINDYLRTKNILTECNYMVLFPMCSLKKQMDYCLEKVGMDKAMKEQIIKYNKSRSLIIHKTYPFYCITLDKIFLIK